MIDVNIDIDLFPVPKRAQPSWWRAITSDAGILLLAAADRAIGLVARYALQFADHRRAELIEQEVSTAGEAAVSINYLKGHRQ